MPPSRRASSEPPELAAVDEGPPAGLYLGSKSYPQPPKHEHSYFGDTEDGTKDMFSHLGVFLCMCLEHVGHSDVKTTWFDFESLHSGCIYSSQRHNLGSITSAHR